MGIKLTIAMAIFDLNFGDIIWLNIISSDYGNLKSIGGTVDTI